jgi:hypothetical protein
MLAIRYELYVLLAGVGFLLLQLEGANPLFIQICLTVLYLVVGLFEARVARYRFLITPPGFFTAYSFLTIMAAGIWYFATDQKLNAQFSVSDASILRGTWYTLVATQVLWLSYYLIPDRPVLGLRPNSSIRIPLRLILVLVVISLFSFFIAVRLNLYGYTADPAKVEYLSYLRFGVELGWLAIILLVLFEFDHPRRRLLLHLLLVGYFLIGLLYGSKSTAVMPLVLTIVTLYISSRRVGWRYLLATALGIVVAFSIIEPFRILYGSGRNVGPVTSVAQLIELYLVAQDASKDMETNYGLAFLERMNYTVPLAKALEFADQTGYMHSEEWGLLAQSPLYGVIPRVIWPNKPQANFGVWASVNIFELGEEATTSTGITPQGYAYLVARLPGVIVFFFLFGIIQKLVFNLLALNRAFLPFYLLILFNVGYPVSPWTFVAGTLQSLILLSPFLFLFAHWSRPSAKPVFSGARGARE